MRVRLFFNQPDNLTHDSFIEEIENELMENLAHERPVNAFLASTCWLASHLEQTAPDLCHSELPHR